jgi:uncharacterized integral membrane protein
MVPWKLVLFLILMTLFVVFAGFNIKNVSDISVGFTTITDVPIFLSLFIAFLAGAFLTLPFAFGRRRKKEKSAAEKMKKEDIENEIREEGRNSDIKKDEAE